MHSAGTEFCVDLAVGGTGTAAVRGSTADLVILVDSKVELDRIPPLADSIRIPLGENDTAQSLLERNSSDPEAAAILQRYRDRPNVPLDRGMAQDPDLGALAIRDRIRSGELDPVFDEILKLAVIKTNGRLLSVNIKEINSYAGGAGSGGAPQLGEYFASRFESETEAIVYHRMLRCGGLGYPFGRQVWGNTNYSTKADLERLKEDRAARRVRNVELFELPLRSTDGEIVGEDRQRRDTLIGTFAEAYGSPAVNVYVEASEVNYRNQSSLGEVRRLRVKWSDFQSPEELRGKAAKYYETAARSPQKLANPTAALPPADVQSVGNATSVYPSANDVAKELEERGGTSGPLLRQALSDDRLPFRASLGFRGKALAAFTAGISAGQVTTVEAQTSLTQLQAFAAEKQQEAERWKAARITSRADLQKMLSENRSFWRWLLDLVNTPLQRRMRENLLLKVIQAMLEAQEKYSLRVAEHEEALAGIQAITNAMQHRMQSLSSAVGQFAAAGEAGLEASLHIGFASPDEIAGQLETAAQTGAEFLGTALLGTVRHVTMAGLARMMRVSEATPEAVAAAIDKDEFVWKSPMWGASSTLASPRLRLVILPPVTPEVQQSLQAALQKRGSQLHLLCADSMAAGAAIVGVDIYPVTQESDVIPIIYKNAKRSHEVKQLQMPPAATEAA
jgi:hypothetical protein